MAEAATLVEEAESVAEDATERDEEEEVAKVVLTAKASLEGAAVAATLALVSTAGTNAF